jgi:uncharacterized membrane protein
MARGRRKKNRQPKPRSPQPILPTPPGSSPPEMQFIATATSYAGPIPPPDALERFNQIIPKGAHRILRMAEKQQAHRHELETKVITSDIRRSWGGLIAGLVVAIVSITLGFLLVREGHDVAGTTVATTTVIGLVATFLKGSTERRQERAEKRQAVAPRH